MGIADDNQKLLIAVLDRIIPRSGEMPGAGEAGVAVFVETALKKDDELAGLFDLGLTEIATESLRQGALFIGLSDEDKDDVLREVELEDLEFFAALIKQAYGGYYTDPAILALLGEDARPPQPSGHKIERGDLSLLDAVRARGQIYRDV